MAYQKKNKWVHVLSEKDVEKETAICAHCGPVKIKIKKNRSPQCYNAWRAQKGGKERPEGGWPKREKPEGGWPKPEGGWKIAYKYDGGTVYVKPAERQELFDNSNQMCQICETPLTLKSARYDHCHRTGVFRGWLCHTCNTGIGFFRDDVKILQNAINYLS